MTDVVYLGLGGNQGAVRTAMAGALDHLDRRPDTTVIAVSPLYRTPPWGKTDQDWFLNCCAELKTTLTASKLLEVCLDLETRFGRTREERWGPRTLDIDLLSFAQLSQDEAHLTLPHPRIAQRAFVLKPLADLSPDLLIDGKSARDHLTGIGGEGIEVADTDRNWWKPKP